jgi:predicted AAA+ superfamily ATPase
MLTILILNTLKTFPATIITGPRQSGKSTLLKNYFNSQTTFINLGYINFRQLLYDDPYSYLKNLKKPVVIDEIQYMPEILSYIKMFIDKDRLPDNGF